MTSATAISSVTIGFRVKVHRDGTSIFRVVSIAEDGRAVVETLLDVPGK